MNNEIWKDIEGYEGLYQVSNLGNIKRIFKSHIVLCKPSFDTRGYKQIVLSKNRKRKSYKVHRLVAKAFIPNHNNLPCINHKDEDKTNNCVDNLEWCTIEYNNNYGTRGYRCTRHKLKKVKLFDSSGKKVIKIYNSLKDAEKETNICSSNISACCRKIIKKAGGFIWEYAE